MKSSYDYISLKIFSSRPTWVGGEYEVSVYNLKTGEPNVVFNAHKEGVVIENIAIANSSNLIIILAGGDIRAYPF